MFQIKKTRFNFFKRIDMKKWESFYLCLMAKEKCANFKLIIKPFSKDFDLDRPNFKQNLIKNGQSQASREAY